MSNWQRFGNFTRGAAGVAIVLVVVPCIALYAFIERPKIDAGYALPVLAIFGIMILFGAMAMVSTLFHRLDLSARDEALALPPGSIRATIALALIVLFSIIAIMLFQTLSRPFVIERIGLTDKTAIVGNPANRIIAVQQVACPQLKAEHPVVAPDSREPCFDVTMMQPVSQEANDMAKQLLILVGTLMTSVTSYYFASQAVAGAKDKDLRAAVREAQRTVPEAQPGAATGEQPPPSPGSGTLSQGSGGLTPAAAPASAGSTPQSQAAPTGLVAPHLRDNADGCDVEVIDPTHDRDLPPTTGGVAS